jgi:hypothetical protein
METKFALALDKTKEKHINADPFVMARSKQLRCCHCGSVVGPENQHEKREMVFECKYEYLDEKKGLPHKAPEPLINLVVRAGAKDWIRIPLTHDKTTQTFTWSKYVACTPQCAYGYMMHSADFVPSNVPTLFHLAMHQTYGISESFVPAPPIEALSYWKCASTKSKKEEDKQIWANGLSFSAFFDLMKHQQLLRVEVLHSNQASPPHPDEALCLSRNDKRFTRYFSFEGLPDQILHELDLTASDLVPLDLNVDHDVEFDFALGTPTNKS